MLRLYNTALLPLLAAVSLRSWWPRHESARLEWDQRRARRLPRIEPGGVWIHGSSVGEARLVAALARGVRRREASPPLAVSAFTPGGRALLPEPPDIDAAFFLPLDFRGYADRVVEALRPRLLVLVETELWPNLLDACRRRSVPVVVVNGRLSRKRMRHYRRWSGLYRPALARLARVGARSAQDAQRFVSLGAREAVVMVTGNLKYDLPRPEGTPEQLRARFSLASERPVFVAGSTGAGEEPLVLDAFVEARRVRPDLFLILAPRHPRRIDEVAALVERRGLRAARLSREAAEAGSRDVLLVDTLGELAQLYLLAEVSFVGGTLVPVGGHNLLEPAAAGTPVLWGPHIQNTVEPAQALSEAGAGHEVADPAELGRVLTELLADRERRQRMSRAAESVIEANRGALERSLDLIQAALNGSAGAS